MLTDTLREYFQKFGVVTSSRVVFVSMFVVELVAIIWVFPKDK